MFAMLEVLSIAAMLLLSSSAGAVSRPTDLTDGQCLADWSQAALVVRMQSLRTAQEVRDLALSRTPGKLLQMTLCREKGRYIYRVVVMSERGRMTDLVVEAR